MKDRFALILIALSIVGSSFAEEVDFNMIFSFCIHEDLICRGKSFYLLYDLLFVEKGFFGYNDEFIGVGGVKTS